MRQRVRDTGGPHDVSVPESDDQAGVDSAPSAPTMLNICVVLTLFGLGVVWRYSSGQGHSEGALPAKNAVLRAEYPELSDVAMPLNCSHQGHAQDGDTAAIECIFASIFDERAGYTGEGKRELGYGEITAGGVRTMLAFLPDGGLSTDDVFVDLGSGTGKVPLQIWISSPAQRSVGIEYVRERHLAGLNALGQLQAAAGVRQGRRQISLVQGDAGKWELYSDVTVVYMASILFPDDLFVTISRNLQQAVPGTAIFTMRQFHGCHPGLIHVGDTGSIVQATWNTATNVELYIVAPRPYRWHPPVGRLDMRAIHDSAKLADWQRRDFDLIAGTMAADGVEAHRFTQYSRQQWGATGAQSQRLLAAALDSPNGSRVEYAHYTLAARHVLMHGSQDSLFGCVCQELRLGEAHLLNLIDDLGLEPTMRGGLPVRRRAFGVADKEVMRRDADAGLLHCAAREGATADVAVALARRGADPFATTAEGGTALHEAAHIGALPMVQALIALRAPVDATDRRKLTPLFRARDGDVAKALIEVRANAAHVAEGGRTALHTAAMDSRAGLVEALLAGRADPLQEDIVGRLPIDYAQDGSAVWELLRGPSETGVDVEGSGEVQQIPV